MIFAGKKVLVFGTGKSGIAAEDLLHKKGASVVLYDGNDKLEKEEILKKYKEFTILLHIDRQGYII